MNEESDPQNIVKKVFDSMGQRSEKVSPLFTHVKQSPKTLTQREPRKTAGANLVLAAIDLGTFSIKMVQLARGPKDLREVLWVDEEPYDLQTNRDWPSRQREALQRLLKRNTVGPNVIVGLSAKEAQVLNFVFPPMSDKELEEAVSWKLRQLRPFDMDLEKIRYSLLKWESRLTAPAVSTQQRVTVVCAPAQTVFGKADFLNQAGLKALAVQVGPVGLVNLRQNRMPSSSSEEVVLWLDLGADETTFVVEKGGGVLFLRNLTVTSRQLTRQVAQYCHVDENRAEDLKRRYGLSFWSPEKETTVSLETGPEAKKEEPETVFHGLVSSLENLVIDIEHSFKYFSYQVSQSQITRFDRVFLSGGGAELQKLSLFLKTKLGVPVERIDPFSGFKIHETIPTQRIERSFHFAVATSLASALFLPNAKRMNLLSVEEKRPAQVSLARLAKDPKKAVLGAVVVVALLLAPEIIRITYYQARAETIERKVKSTRAELSRLQADQLKSSEEETKLLDKKALLESKFELLKESMAGRRKLAEVLASLSAVLPEEIWVTKLSYAGKKFTLVGLTLKNELIIRFIEELKKSQDFRDVAFDYAQKETNSAIYRFQVITSVR